MVLQQKQLHRRLLVLVCAGLWSLLLSISYASGQPVQLLRQSPKADSSHADSVKQPHPLSAEIHENWFFREMGFECSRTEPRTITKVIPGTQAFLNGLQPGDQLVGVQQHGATAFIDVRRGKNVYRATITSEPKPQSALQKSIVESSSEKTGRHSNQSNNELFLIADCDLSTTMDIITPTIHLTPLQWCKQQMAQLDSKSAESFPDNVTFITYSAGGYSMYEHCSIERVKQLWMQQNGGQIPQRSGDPLQDIVNSYLERHSPEDRKTHKLIVAIVSTEVATSAIPPPSTKAGGIGGLGHANATKHKLDLSDVSITVLQLGNDPRAIELDSNSYNFAVESIKYRPFSYISDDGLLPALSRIFQGE